jgi:hypothetical protein
MRPYKAIRHAIITNATRKMKAQDRSTSTSRPERFEIIYLNRNGERKAAQAIGTEALEKTCAELDRHEMPILVIHDENGEEVLRDGSLDPRNLR